MNDHTCHIYKCRCGAIVEECRCDRSDKFPATVCYACDNCQPSEHPAPRESVLSKNDLLALEQGKTLVSREEPRRCFKLLDGCYKYSDDLGKNWRPVTVKKLRLLEEVPSDAMLEAFKSTVAMLDAVFHERMAEDEAQVSHPNTVVVSESGEVFKARFTPSSGNLTIVKRQLNGKYKYQGGIRGETFTAA